ncbi:indolepyruvate ferredoxin oxidoreductase subunit beta [Chloroflexota bacterium]
MVMIKELNVIICGVGGQGVVLLSELLGNAAVKDGIEVRGSEVLGMAQRGGSVFSNIRLGSNLYAPMTPEGKCDVLIAVEPSEALRNMHFLSKTSLVVLNSRKIIPPTVFLGKSGYPSLEDILENLNKASDRVVMLDAAQIAEEAGSLQSTNVVMLGALFGTGVMPVKSETIKTLIEARFPAKVASLNINAFDLGYQAVKQALAV